MALRVIVTVAVLDLVGSAMLVAVTVTVTVEASRVGAVNTPKLEIEPTGGWMLQVTALFAAPITAAVN